MKFSPTSPSGRMKLVYTAGRVDKFNMSFGMMIAILFYTIKIKLIQ